MENNNNRLPYDTMEVCKALAEDYNKGELINMSIKRGKIEYNYFDRNTGNDYFVVKDLD